MALSKLSGKAFVDTDFPPDNSSLFRDPGAPCASLAEVTIEWRRASSLFPQGRLLPESSPSPVSVGCFVCSRWPR